MAKAKTRGSNLPVPQSDAQAEQMVAQLGALQRDHAADQLRHDAEVAVLEEAFGVRKKVHEEAERVIVESLAIWATAHRERLTGGGRTKTVQLASGSLSWREGLYAVRHRGLKNEDVVAAIRERIAALEADLAQAKRDRKPRLGAEITAKLTILEGFLRTKVEPNKEAMLADRAVAETVRGVTVTRSEESFAVEPLASQIGEVA